MKISRLSYFAFALGYYFGYLMLLFGFVVLFGDSDRLTGFDFSYFDATHYASIKETGYEEFLTAFFPGFPYLWKCTNLGFMGISIFNGLLFCLAISSIAYYLKWNWFCYLICLALPSLVFMFLPYSESVFFICASCLLLGYWKNKAILLYAGLFLCSLVRPTAAVFLPALFLTEFLSNSKNFWVSGRLVIGSCTIVLGLFLSLLAHQIDTGSWFSFFTSQLKWGNAFRIPKIPLSSWSGNLITMVDGFTLWITLICSALIIRKLLLRLNGQVSTNAALNFSLLYVAGSGLYVLFFRGGALFSLNRFVFASPFIMYLVSTLFKNENVESGNSKWIAATFLPFSLLMGSYVHIQNFLKYAMVQIVAIGFVMSTLSGSIIGNISKYLIAILLIVLQVYFGFRVVNGMWIG